MKLTRLITSLSVLVAVAAGVTTYQLTSAHPTDSPEPVGSVPAQQPGEPGVELAPCPADTVRAGKECVRTVVETQVVDVPAPVVTAAPAPVPASSREPQAEESKPRPPRGESPAAKVDDHTGEKTEEGSEHDDESEEEGDHEDDEDDEDDEAEEREEPEH